MQMDGYRVVTVDEGGPALVRRIQRMIDAVWPLYIQEAKVAGFSEYAPDWFGIYERWPQFQFGLFAGDGTMVAAGNALVLAWDGDATELPETGWDWLMHQAAEDFAAERAPRTFAALSASIPKAARGKELSRTIVRTMRALAKDAGFARLIAPVRPSLKSRYPLIPIEAYVTWTKDEGLPWDPWMRTHARLGARIARPCPRSMTMGGTVADWEGWCGVPLPGSGRFVLPDLLAPLAVDHQHDRCVYVEPNVWMEHRL